MLLIDHQVCLTNVDKPVLHWVYSILGLEATKQGPFCLFEWDAQPIHTLHLANQATQYLVVSKLARVSLVAVFQRRQDAEGFLDQAFLKDLVSQVSFPVAQPRTHAYRYLYHNKANSVVRMNVDHEVG